MAEKVLALYGRGVGPRIPIRGKTAVAEVNGVSPENVKYHIETTDGRMTASVAAGTSVALPAGSFVEVEYSGSAQKLLCFVRM